MDRLIVPVWGQAKVTGLDRLDDVADDGLVEGANQNLLRFWSAQVCKLFQWGERAIVLDTDRVDQADIRPAGPARL